VQALISCELQILTLTNFFNMQAEFQEYYNELLAYSRVETEKHLR
jgi:hypothetical protein